VDVRRIVKSIQNISFENAGWAYLIGAAVAIKKNQIVAAEIAETLGAGLQAFCIPGSVADDRKVGIGHGNLAAMLLREETGCFGLCAGHESFAAAEGAIGLARSANNARKIPCASFSTAWGKDAALIISRVNGIHLCADRLRVCDRQLNVVREKAYSTGERAAVRCYGADDVREGVAIMHLERVDVAIPATRPTPRASSIR